MAYQIAADMVLIMHLAFVLFAIFGSLIILRWQKIFWFHLPAFIWAAWIEFSGAVCPLTPLESWLRQKGGKTGYQEGFIEHYIEPVIYPSGLTRKTQLILGATFLMLNCCLYGFLLFHTWRKDKIS